MPPAPLRRPSLADVARLAGVSTATVSRVLNDPSLVRSQTREQVERAVATLGYTPHFGGRALASNRTDTVGAIIPTMENAIFARGLQALQERLTEEGVTLLVSTSNYDPVQEADQIQTLLSRSVDGLILIGESRDENIYELLRRRSVPFVLVWTWREDCPWTCVGFDNRAAACDVTEHVLNMGHRRIAMVAGVTKGNDRARSRVEGVRSTLYAHGASLEPRYLIESAYTLHAGADATRHLINQTPKPTAIICGNDVLAAGAMMACRDAGLRVPEDLSITGFDDIEIAKLLDPPLATVHVPHRRMGRIAADVLIAMMEPESEVESIRINTNFVERSSLGPA